MQKIQRIVSRLFAVVFLVPAATSLHAQATSLPGSFGTYLEVGARGRPWELDGNALEQRIRSGIRVMNRFFGPSPFSWTIDPDYIAGALQRYDYNGAAISDPAGTYADRVGGNRIPADWSVEAEARMGSLRGQEPPMNPYAQSGAPMPNWSLSYPSYSSVTGAFDQRPSWQKPVIR